MDREVSRQVDKMLLILNQDEAAVFTDEEVQDLVLKFPPSHCIGTCFPFIFSVADGKFLYLGSKVEALTGYSQKEFMHSKASEFVPMMMKHEHAVLMLKSTMECFTVLRSKFAGAYDVQVNMDFSIQKKDGKSERLMLQFRPLKWDGEGNIIVTGGYAVDITHLKKEGHPVVTITSYGDVLFSFETVGKDLVAAAVTDYTKRELELIQMMADGQDIDEIVDKTGLSKATVYAHRRNILAKSEESSIIRVVESLKAKGII